MKDRKGDDWFPFWIDKWLLGSTRDELIIRDEHGNFVEDLRGIFTDLMAMAYKDSGYIRANEGMPYSTRRLAGSLDIPQEKLDETIAICLKTGKLEAKPDGTLFLTSLEKYELPERTKQRRDKELREVADKDDRVAKKVAKVAEKSATLYSPLISSNSSLARKKERPEGWTIRTAEIVAIFSNREFAFSPSIVIYITDLTFEFPEVDWKEEIEKKLAHLKDHPPKKGSNVALQFRNWFVNARKFAAERARNDQVGTQQPVGTPPLVPKDDFKEAQGAKIAEIMAKYKDEAEAAEKNLDRIVLQNLKNRMRSEYEDWLGDYLREKNEHIQPGPEDEEEGPL